MNIRTIAHRIKNLGNNTPVLANPIREFYIDSPHSIHVGAKTVHVEGWVIPTDGFEIQSMRIRNNETEQVIHYGKERKDVSVSRPGANSACGFDGEIEFVDGTFVIEVQIRDDFIAIYSAKIIYSPEKMVDMLLNPRLAEFNADHENLLSSKQSYYFEEDSTEKYIRKENDPRLIAFYLPQFHPAEVNDMVWGKGFTEWTNVTKAVPRFVGHQQPLLPSGLGFYDLRVEDTIEQQIDLAKSHGIYGFCIYYYWFSGKKILDTPIQTILKNKEWDFHFSICWANENWTKRWDGRDNDVIISQEYLDTDPLDFIKDVAPILNDPRYITKDGKPLLVVYRASDLKDPKRYADIWRSYFKETYNKELYLVSSMGFEINDPREYGFDIGLDFSPQTNFFKTDIFENNTLPTLNQKVHYLDPNFNGSIVRYSDTALNENINDYFTFPTINSIVPSWDNDARKNGLGFIMYGSNPTHYGRWLRRALNQARESQGDAAIVFLNAWNEWAEGAVLEPSRSLGYANLNETTRALQSSSRDIEKDVAVVIHISTDVDALALNKQLKRLSNRADVYITVIAKFLQNATELMQLMPNASLRVVPDRGRDIFPFFFTVGRFEHTYNYLLKFSVEGGIQEWKSVADLLLPENKDIDDLLALLDNDELPKGAENSFWATKHYVKKMMQNKWILEDFRPETDQSSNQLIVNDEIKIKTLLDIDEL